MICNAQAKSLVAALLEGEDPKSFLLCMGRKLSKEQGIKRVAEYDLEDIGIEHSQYFQGRGTSYTHWDAVYTGIGDNPNEAVGDALDSAAQDGWVLDNIAQEADNWPEEPSVSARIQREAEDAAREMLDRDDFEDDESYNAAVEELTGEILSDGESELHYHAAVWLREPKEGEPIIGAQQEAENPKDILRSIGREPRAPSTWPKIPRWQKDRRWGRERERRRGFYIATRHRIRRDPTGAIARDAEGQATYDPYEVRKGLPHTRFYRNRDDHSHWIEYYSTNILTWDRMGTCTMNNGGHRTMSTRDRMNQFLPGGWRLHTYRGEWYWFNNQWPENIRDRLWADQAARRSPIYPWWIPYNNYDQIRSDGTLLYGGRSAQGGKNGMATPSGGLKTPEDATMRPIPVGPQTMPRRARRDPYGRDPNQFQFRLEGKYMRQLDRWKRVKAKHEKMKDVAKLQRELEKVDKPDNKKKPKKGHQNIR